MSNQTAPTAELRRSPTISTPDFGRIVLIDRTEARNVLARADSASTEYETAETETVTTPLHKKLTSSSLGIQQSVRNQVARQKYRRFDRDRYELDQPKDDETDADSAQVPDDADGPIRQLSYLERSRTKAKKFMKRKRRLGTGKDKEDTVIDVLWENQRGSFLFGVPRYSANSLLPSDPRPWQNAEFRTSPVDIRNAQVPDPSWEWAWKSWYVDMSRDVDEEGWDYSLAFKINFSWHGNHPWFHSFVRRRRWLRMRTRKKTIQNSNDNKQDPHDLASEYFTIHPQPTSTTDGHERQKMELLQRNEDIGDKVEISNVGQLMLLLRRAASDREKLSAIHSFLVHGEGEIGYLRNRISDVMGMLLYQASRRQVVAELIAFRRSKDNFQPKNINPAQGDSDYNEHSSSSTSAEYLDSIIEGAKVEIRRLEYWSDMKGLEGTDEVEDTKYSQDGKKSFSSKQAAQMPGNSLHKHPEHAPKNRHQQDAREDTDLYKTASAIIMSSTESVPDEESNDGEDYDGETDLERYTTAAESASEMTSSGLTDRRQKGRARSKYKPLSGVREETN